MLPDLQRFWSEELCSQQQINQVVEVSHVLGSVQRNWSQIGDLCKAKKSTTRSSPIGYWSEKSTIGWYFGIGQGSGKILHTCDRLIVN